MIHETTQFLLIICQSGQPFLCLSISMMPILVFCNHETCSLELFALVSQQSTRKMLDHNGCELFCFFQVLHFPVWDNIEVNGWNWEVSWWINNCFSCCYLCHTVDLALQSQPMASSSKNWCNHCFDISGTWQRIHTTFNKGLIYPSFRCLPPTSARRLHQEA